MRHFWESGILLGFVLLSVVACQRQDTRSEAKEVVSASHYIPLEDYLQAHPEQISISAKFEASVAGTAPKIRAAKAVTIALVYPGGQASDYWRRQEVVLTKRLEEAGLPHKLLRFKSDFRTNDVRSREKMFAAVLQAAPDYLIFNMDSATDERLLEQAMSGAKAKIIVQNLTSPLRRLEGAHPLLYTGFCHRRGTRMLFKHFREQGLSRTHAAILYYRDGPVNEQRGVLFAHLLSDSKASLVGEYYAEGLRPKARKATLDAISSGANLIYASSTDAALGALDAVGEVNRHDEIVVNGWGGGSAELEALREGRLDVTVMRMNDDAGVAAADAIVLSELGREAEVPTVFSGRFSLVTPADVPGLPALQARAFRYSGVGAQPASVGGDGK